MKAGEEQPNIPPRPALSEQKRRLLEQRLNRSSRSIGFKDDGIPKRPPNNKTLASLGQARIWVLNDLSEKSPSYNITSSFEVLSSIDKSALRIALNKVVERHEPLRSTYRLEDGEVIQHAIPSPELEIDQQNCKDLASARSSAQIYGRIPFDVETGPLLRVGLFTASQEHHVLILSIHDLVFDKWSLKVFWNEFSEFYRQATDNTIAKLATLPISYSDFSHWQRRWLEEGNRKRQIEYWKEKLKATPPPIPLPTDFPYPQTIGDPGGLERSILDESTSRKAKEFSAQNDVSLFTTFLLGFSILLSRYSETENILISSPVANRRKKETANLIGFFLNTLVVRADLTGNPTVREALARTRLTVLEALDNQDLPTDAIVDAIKPSRVTGRHPLFQTMFVYQREDEGTPKLSLKDCRIEPIFIETKTSKFDLSLFVAESGNAFETVAEYRTDIFQAKTIQKFLEHFNVLMGDLVANPSKRAQELEILTPEERTKLLHNHKNSAFGNQPKETLPEAILSFASTRPKTIAITGPNSTFTYQELEKRTAGLARALVELPRNEDAPVGIFLERSPEAIIAIIAALRSGAAYLPLDPHYPKKRNQSIIQDALPFAFIASQSESSTIKEVSNSPILSILHSNSSNTQLPKLSVDNNAYLIYTSGSSGQPKGVMVTHRNLSYSTLSRTHFYPTPPSRYLLVSSLAFDSSVAGIFWTLSTGNTLVTLGAGLEREPDAIREAVRRFQATHLLCIPTLFREVIAADFDKLSTLNTAIVAGESCPPELAKTHYRRLPNCSLYNEYGPTETTVWCTATKLDKDSPTTIGVAIPYYEIHVLSPHQQTLPSGVPGELCVSGPGVAKGYLNQSDLTKKRFPTITLPDGRRIRMYRTGDKVKRLHNGELEYLGRIDGQIKVNGFRFEPGETETALDACPNIVASNARLISNEHNDPNTARLVGYIVTDSKFDGDFKALKARLSNTLPIQAIPTQFVLIDAIPRLPNGKIDYKKLPVPDVRENTAASFEKPTTPTERKLVEIWKEALDIERVSTNDNFFDLGGTSLQAIRIFSKIRTAFEASLSSSRLLQAPTVAHLARLLDEESRPKASKCLVPLKTKGNLTPIFLIHSGGLQVLFYKDLAKRIDDRIPLYGLQAVGHDGSEKPLTRIQDMATRYLSEIEEIHPHGPFIFLGHCFGVTVALEMARQLQSRNKDVPLVVSIDGEAPYSLDHQTPAPAPLFPNYPKGLRFLRIKVRQLRHAIRKTRTNFIYRFGSEESKELILLKRTRSAIGKAFSGYRESPYSQPVLGFRCLDSDKYANHSEKDWRRAAPNIEMHHIACRHEELISEPTVQKTAAIINRKLASLPPYASLQAED
ncbi:AMP-binding enzyme domain protein [Verrucomicrobiia bacterium DG1235]|nr:AMP-binding enzyme domain protein [Verrucomicrobiae bacterium DG1235]